MPVPWYIYNIVRNSNAEPLEKSRSKRAYAPGGNMTTESATMQTRPAGEWATYKEFWHFYLGEHRDPLNRTLHFLGTAGVFIIAGISIYLQNYWLLFLMPVSGYGFAWFGHFIIEKNKPATFKAPFRSLFSDFRMFFNILFFRIGKHLKEAGIQS